MNLTPEITCQSCGECFRPTPNAYTNFQRGAQKSLPCPACKAKNVMPQITVIHDKEFQAILPKSTEDERHDLEESLLAEGCRDPIVIWKEQNIILDGYNRMEFCLKHRIPYKVEYISLPDRDAAIEWIVHNQLGRRNLSDTMQRYYRGKEYRKTKQPHGGSREASPQAGDLKRTADIVGEKHGVSGNTIERDAKFSEAVDAVAEAEGKSPPEVIQESSKPDIIAKANGEPAAKPQRGKKQQRADFSAAVGKVSRLCDELKIMDKKTRYGETVHQVLQEILTMGLRG